MQQVIKSEFLELQIDFKKKMKAIFSSCRTMIFCP